MVYAISEICRRVLVALGESPSYLDLHIEYDGDWGVDLRKRIEALIVSEARRLICEAPMQDIDEWKRFTAPVSYSESGIGTISLPEDYCRFVALRMEGWETAVSEILPENSGWLSLQRDRYRRGMAMTRRPHVAYGRGPYGRVIMVLGIARGARLEMAAYLPDPVTAATDPDSIWLPPSLSDTLVKNTVLILNS